MKSADTRKWVQLKTVLWLHPIPLSSEKYREWLHSLSFKDTDNSVRYH